MNGTMIRDPEWWNTGKSPKKRPKEGSLSGSLMTEAGWPAGRAMQYFKWSLMSRNGHSHAGQRMSLFRSFLSCWNNLQINRLANCKPVVTHFWLPDYSYTDFHSWQDGGGFFFFPQNTKNDIRYQGPDVAKIPALQRWDFQHAELKDNNFCAYLLGHQEEMF